MLSPPGVEGLLLAFGDFEVQGGGFVVDGQLNDLSNFLDDPDIRWTTSACESLYATTADEACPFEVIAAGADTLVGGSIFRIQATCPLIPSAKALEPAQKRAEHLRSILGLHDRPIELYAETLLFK